MDVKDLYEKLSDYMNKEIVLQGWIRNHRKQKELVLLIFLMVLVLNMYKLYMMIN